MFKTNFSWHNKFWDHCTQMPLRGYGPANINAILPEFIEQMQQDLQLFAWLDF